jgi:hypothetical protein
MSDEVACIPHMEEAKSPSLLCSQDGANIIADPLDNFHFPREGQQRDDANSQFSPSEGEEEDDNSSQHSDSEGVEVDPNAAQDETEEFFEVKEPKDKLTGGNFLITIVLAHDTPK